MKYQRNNLSVYLAIVLSSLSLISCANNQGSGDVEKVPEKAPYSGAASSGSTSGGSTSTTTDPLTISDFYPPAGTLYGAPARIEVTFSKSTLETASATKKTNYTLSCSNGTFNPTDILVDGEVVILTMPSITLSTTTTNCTFAVSSSVKDTSGVYLSGTRYASYTLKKSTSPTGDPVSSDETAPVGSILSPLQGDRLFGSVTLKAHAYDTGENQSGVATVEYWMAGVKLGSSSVSPYQISFSSSVVPNGAQTLSLTIIDKAGNKAENVDSHNVVIANYAYTTTITAGGAGGGAFKDTAPAEMNLAGFTLKAGAHVDSITPVFMTAYGDDIGTWQGPSHGGPGGSSGTLACPATGNYRVVGLYGNATHLVNAIGIICQPQAGGALWWSPVAGTRSGSAFQLFCPEGKFATVFQGRSGLYVDQVQLGCK